MNFDFSKAINHLKEEYAKLQIGRASASLVESLMVDAYGMTQPVKAVASVSVPDAKTIHIQTWDKTLLSAVEKAIQHSDLNLNPVNNGAAVILNIPPLTEERRRDLIKVVGRLAEEARVSIRNLRHDYLADVKKREHEGEMSEDEQNRQEKRIQELVDEANKAVAELAKVKEDAIMTV